MTRFLSFPARLRTWRLALLYLCYAVPAGCFLLVATPPFQTPDAANHFFRATQVAQGGWLAKNFGGTSGGPIDEGASTFAAIFDPIAHHPEVKLTTSMDERGRSIRWSGENRTAEFPNTAIYPAYAYAPQALAIDLGRALNASVRATYLAACAAGLLVSVALTAWAIALARRTALALFAIATLPCTAMLFSSVSQDTTVVPLCFLLIAFTDRSIDESVPVSPRSLVLMALACVVAVSARPPYAGLLVMMFAPGLRIEAARYASVRRLVWFCASAAAAAFATLAFSRSGWAPVAPPRSIGGQLGYLSHAPLQIFHLAIATLKAYGGFYFASFVGVLGWLDASFRHGYYALAMLMFAALALACALPADAQREPRAADRGAAVAAFAASAAMIFGSLYLTWTPVGNAVVEGVQGRYFLALAPLLALALAAPGARANRGLSVQGRGVRRVRALCVLIVLAFPFVTFIELVGLILHRYYL
ncbi:hypothetical protein AWB82_06292 [Caballeronia glebae]|uniref:DUF2142 domain-containing protein n=1 Tax=Caballeronia glebae TaxID=1777143 RepID=A0A158D4V9_9BURK|nr:DUF2142 domain-containing protein [Caballeronia glebae]SAK89714.1 hypothetical protein AWB82_06292 [Caballeronia glebae]